MIPPHPVDGYTFLGSYTYSTYSILFTLYKNNKTGELYQATPGDPRWVPQLKKLEGYDKKLFSPKIQ